VDARGRWKRPFVLPILPAGRLCRD
jgi:hypothetical protein